jgi:Xaa-Pro aminopeptidase
LLLGISERQAGELAIRQWIQRNRNQVSLETWTEARSSLAPVNRALMNVQLTVVKAELGEILDVLQVIKPEHELEILRKLQKLMPTAQAWVEETRDKELGEVLAAVAAKLTL